MGMKPTLCNDAGSESTMTSSVGTTLPGLQDQTGKVAIITGSNVGLGFETAKALLARNATVVIATRSPERGPRAVRDLKQQFAGSAGRAIFMQLDLAAFRSIKSFASSFKAMKLPLHILINNACTSLVPDAETEEGFEVSLGVNHIGHAYLAQLLLDNLIESAPSRIVVVTSITCRDARLRGNELKAHNGRPTGMAEYAASKLLNILYFTHLRTLLEASDVQVLMCHPGFAHSDGLNKVDKCKWWSKLAVFLDTFLAQPTQQGATSMIKCAADSDVSAGDVAGKWYGPNIFNQGNNALRDIPNKLCMDPAACKQVYDDTLAAIKQFSSVDAISSENSSDFSHLTEQA